MEKKTKLTISGNPKKSFKKIASPKTQGKKTVVIEKKSIKSSNKSNFSKSFGSKPTSGFKHGSSFKSNFPTKTSS